MKYAGHHSLKSSIVFAVTVVFCVGLARGWQFHQPRKLAASQPVSADGSLDLLNTPADAINKALQRIDVELDTVWEIAAAPAAVPDVTIRRRQLLSQAVLNAGTNGQPSSYGGYGGYGYGYGSTPHRGLVELLSKDDSSALPMSSIMHAMERQLLEPVPGQYGGYGYYGYGGQVGRRRSQLQDAPVHSRMMLEGGSNGAYGYGYGGYGYGGQPHGRRLAMADLDVEFYQSWLKERQNRN